MKTTIQVYILVVLVVLQMFHHLLVLVITVKLVILIAIGRMVNFIVLILSGMVKVVPFNLVEIYIKS